MTRIVYSAYNAAPRGLGEGREAEDLWYQVLRSEHRISGLELAFVAGGLHPQGLDRLAGLLDPRWSNTVSLMPMTLVASASDPGYGLASRDHGGRQRALDDVAVARDEALRLRRLLGAPSISSVALQSAPRADRSSPDAFSDSLGHIAGWDWHGIELLVEHSDALVPGQEPQKGYLTLDQEAAAVQAAALPGGQRIRHLLNWGRSAIEGRNAATPRKHIRGLGGRLGAFAFSGAGPVASVRGGAWEDVHLGLSEDEPESLLTAAGVRSVAARLPGGLSYLGIKTGPPAGSRGVDRLRLGLSMLDILAGFGPGAQSGGPYRRAADSPPKSSATMSQSDSGPRSVV